jgi:hypothetical protein
MKLRGLALSVAVPFLASSASAAIVTVPSIADTFVTAGSAATGAGNPDANYGGAGTMQISGALTTKGEMQALLKFDLSSVKSSFDAAFGVGNWLINSITLQLATNVGTQGVQPSNQIFNAINTGVFKINWQTNDAWGGEGLGNPGNPFVPDNPPTDGVTWNSLHLLLGGSDENVGTFTYTPVGNTNPPTVPPASYALGLTPGFLADVTAGNPVSLRGYAGDNTVSYLFNAHTFGSNSPTLVINAEAIPEPAVIGLLGASAACLALRRRRHAHGA